MENNEKVKHLISLGTNYCIKVYAESRYSDVQFKRLSFWRQSLNFLAILFLSLSPFIIGLSSELNFQALSVTLNYGHLLAIASSLTILITDYFFDKELISRFSICRSELNTMKIKLLNICINAKYKSDINANDLCRIINYHIKTHDEILRYCWQGFSMPENNRIFKRCEREIKPEVNLLLNRKKKRSNTCKLCSQITSTINRNRSSK